MKRIEAVNDFVVKFANVNGSGSASANELFAKAILRMGVPVSPRNIFPSNIQGLPTWYEVRVSGHGWLGRRGGIDMAVAMNPQTWEADVDEVEPGGYLFYDSTKPLPASAFRSDINVIGMPVTAICNATYEDPRQRTLFKNIMVLGALSVLMDVDPAVIESLFGEQYKGKERLLESNVRALYAGRSFATDHLRPPQSPAMGLKVKRADLVGERIFIEGNAAAALGCVYGGATVCAWYPITPSSSLAEAFERYCRKYRVDPQTGENRFAIIQAEDEIASVGIVTGAGWNGARAFTATSGPGVSLMTEFIGLAYFAEIPLTIIDVQRGGPSTGMPTRTQQADLISCAYASHGDTKHVMLLPQDPAECFEHAAAALDLADRLQTPVFVMTDLDIGMNQRLCEPLAWDESRRYDRGKVMSAAELEAGKDFGRYKDVDGDGIPWRTLPGTHSTKGSYFTRGTTRDAYARYSETGPDYIYNVQRLLKKFDTATRLVPPPQVRAAAKKTRLGVMYFGSTAPAMDEALAALAGRRHPPRRDAAACISVSRERARVHRHPRPRVCRGAKPRCADAHAADQRARNRSVVADRRAALRRHTDHRALHHRQHHQARARAGGGTASRESQMTYITKPKLHHPSLTPNKVGYTRRDYEGKVSTLCAGCGHDSISAAIVQACWELDIEPHRVAKLSGIGCSSKTPDYFLGASHGFNTVHGRMPSVLTGANLANRELLYLGVSGDGDSASIGLGQFAHAMRRGVRMVYIVENNGVYGLTKGQFSATADRGSRSKKGAVNNDAPVDLIGMALQLGASYVARGFSGDKAQLVPLIKGAIGHGGAAFLDVISPCVAFNNHAGSTRSYDHVRQHNEALNRIDFIALAPEIKAEPAPGEVLDLPQADGTVMRLRKLHADYDATDHLGAMNHLQLHQARGEVVTGLIYVDPKANDLHAALHTSAKPLNGLNEPELCPGAAALAKINASLR